MELLDDIGWHVDVARSLDRAAVMPGVFFAWCVNLNLIDRAFLEEHEREVLRLRYRDLTPGEFFVRAAAGRLALGHLTERGRSFARDHYEDYPAEFASAMGVAIDAVYDVKDSWDSYDAVAKRLTAAYFAFAHAGHQPHAKRRHWWQVWR